MAIYQTYTVKAGDTLGKIATQFGTSADAIATMSKLANKNVIKPGDVLNVREIGEIYHLVQKGDTLSGIAAHYKVSAKALQLANGIANPSQIGLGAKLIIPVAQPSPTASSTSPVQPLGSLSKKYEVAKDGPGTVSTGKGDHGGVSYGSYQLSSKMNRPVEFLMAEGKPWLPEFGTTTQGTPEFSAIWKTIAKREPVRFEAAQHDYIQRTHFDVQAKKILTATGLDVKQQSRALQNAVWSVSVQHGPSAALIVNQVKALALPHSDPGYDKALIIAIYGERGRLNANGALVHFPNSSDNQTGLMERFRKEMKDALDMLAAEKAVAALVPPTPPTPPVIAAAPVPKPAPAEPQDVIKRAKAKLSDDDIRLIVEKYGDQEANSDFLAGKRVLISLRNSTNYKAFRKGAYDDLLLMVQRQANGSVSLLRFPICTEPAGEYAFDGAKARKKYGVDTNRDGRLELGRLAAGTYHYVRQKELFLKAPYFKSRQTQVAERDSNHDGRFSIAEGDTLDPTGAGRSMHIHRGGAEGVATWSAACQTIPYNRYTAFLNAVGDQGQISYILINAS